MENNKMRLLDGCYKVKDSFCQHWEVTGDRGQELIDLIADRVMTPLLP